LFAVSVDKKIMGGYMVWFIMAAIGSLAIITSGRVKDGVEEREKARERDEYN